jgi:hypothetical protein
MPHRNNTSGAGSDSVVDDSESGRDTDIKVSRRAAIKLLALSTTATTAVGGTIAITAGSARADAGKTAGDVIEPVRAATPGDMDYVRLDGDTEFTIEWGGLTRGMIIDVFMSIKLIEVEPENAGAGSSIPVNDDWGDPIGKIAVRVDEGGSTENKVHKVIRGTDFFENRDYIPLTEASGIDIDRIEPSPADYDSSTYRMSKFKIRLNPVARGVAGSSGEWMEWIVDLRVDVDIGFGEYFGYVFGGTDV